MNSLKADMKSFGELSNDLWVYEFYVEEATGKASVISRSTACNVSKAKNKFVWGPAYLNALSTLLFVPGSMDANGNGTVSRVGGRFHLKPSDRIPGESWLLSPFKTDTGTFKLLDSKTGEVEIRTAASEITIPKTETYPGSVNFGELYLRIRKLPLRPDDSDLLVSEDLSQAVFTDVPEARLIYVLGTDDSTKTNACVVELKFSKAKVTLVAIDLKSDPKAANKPVVENPDPNPNTDPDTTPPVDPGAEKPAAEDPSKTATGAAKAATAAPAKSGGGCAAGGEDLALMFLVMLPLFYRRSSVA